MLVFDKGDIDKAFTFEVREKGEAASHPGYTYDSNVYEVSIGVYLSEEGKLKASTTVTDSNGTVVDNLISSVGDEAAEGEGIVLPFVNAYEASTDPGRGGVSLGGNKTLLNTTLTENRFKFQIRPKFEGSSAILGPVGNRADGAIDFGTIEYTIESLAEAEEKGFATKVVGVDGNATWNLGYYAEEVVDESKFESEGISPTRSQVAFEVVVMDDGKGALIANAVLPDGGLDFLNTYADEESGSAKIELYGQKLMSPEGSPFELKGEDFNFTLEPQEGDEGAAAHMPENRSASNDEFGNVKFDEIEFGFDAFGSMLPDPDDNSRSKDFHYVVKEELGSENFIGYDDSEQHVVVTLHDDGRGHLSATARAENPEQDSSVQFIFTNTYEPDPGIGVLGGEGGISITKEPDRPRLARR